MWGQSAPVGEQCPGEPEPGRTATLVRCTDQQAETVAPQPTETRLRRAGSVTPLAAHRARASSRLGNTYVNLGLVVCPLVSGLFFGLMATVLVLFNGSFGHAFEVGALTGTIMFAANALALCMVMTPNGERSAPRAEAPGHPAAGVRAS
jgi:hypothetical protein